MQWIIDNKEWLFGGLGITILGAVFSVFKRNERETQPVALNNTISQEKISKVNSQPIPIKNGAVIGLEKKQKIYTVSVIPQATGLFEKDAKKEIEVYCLASSFKNVAVIISAILTQRLSYQEIDNKNFECGRWYEGNKYFIGIKSHEKYNNIDLSSKEIIDGEKILTEIEETLKRERKEKAAEAKAIKEKNPPVIIKSETYNQSLLESSKEISRSPIELRLNMPAHGASGVVNIQSNSMENTYYEIDIQNVSCPCGDFKKQQRYLYSNTDIRRFCRHLATAFSKKLKIEQTEIVSKMLGYGIKENINEYTFKSGIKYYISYNNENDEWIDVFARKRKPGEKNGLYTGDYERFGFNKSEKRWSYADGPDGASEIKPILIRKFGKT